MREAQLAAAVEPLRQNIELDHVDIGRERGVEAGSGVAVDQCVGALVADSLRAPLAAGAAAA